MKHINQALMNELGAHHGPRHLLAMCDQSLLDDKQRERLRARFEQRAFPLLRDSSFEALFPYSPLLLAAKACNAAGHRALLEEFAEDPGVLPHGWIVSTVPAEPLAAHLARANVAHGPQGDVFLLRYFDALVLPVLYQYADSHWKDALMAPIVSWWVPVADAGAQRWGRLPGLAMAECGGLSPLLIDDQLWQSLIADPLPHQLLKAIQTHLPDQFDTPCPGVRLARVEALLATARKAGLNRHVDLHDYVFITLTHNPALSEIGDDWQHAIDAAAAGKGRLGELYLKVRQRPV